MLNNSLVNINVRKHKVTIEDELHVKISHNKDCETHCLEKDAIIDYLLAEMFLAEGFIVTDEGEI